MGIETLSGIKINLQKTELFLILGSGICTNFQYKVGQFLLQYLGLPLKDKKLTVADWQFFIDKVENRLQS